MATAIGAALALVGGHLLWPSFERRELPALLRRSLQSAAGYAASALDGARLTETRRAAGLDTTNFQMSAHRALSEVGLSSHHRDNIAVAAASLQRLMLAINDTAHEARRSDVAPAAERLLASLAQGKSGGHDIVGALRRLARASADKPLDRIGAEVEILTHCQENWS